MWLKDSDQIFKYHRDMIDRHGAQSSYALGWRDAESQLIRFQVLAEIADLNGHSVLDAGCGYGDLQEFLTRRHPQLQRYCGIEQIPELVDEAIHRHRHNPNVSFISGSFISRKLPVLDYVMASGSLNYHNSDPDFIFKAIDRLFSSCTKGLAFNLLRQITPNGLLVAYEPDVILEYCRTLSVMYACVMIMRRRIIRFLCIGEPKLSIRRCALFFALLHQSLTPIQQKKGAAHSRQRLQTIN